jgi:hypothetical protein
MLGNLHRTKRATRMACMAEKTNECRVLKVRFKCIGICSLLSRRVCSILYYNCIYDRHPEDELWVLKHIKDIKT